MIGVSQKIHNLALETRGVIIMIVVSYETQNHVTLKSVIIMVGVLLGERKSNEKASVVPPDFYGIYNLREFCDWIARLDYYFDLYELFEKHSSICYM